MAGRKRPSSESNLNSDYSKILVEVGEYERDVNRNIHKYNAYRKAAAVIASYPTKLTSAEEAIKLPGIGEKIAEKLDEIIKTGKLRKLEEINKDDFSVAVRELSQVSGIGPVKAQELVKSGIKTIKELRENADGLTHHQLIGLKYHEDFIQRIPREEITKIEEILQKEFTSIDSHFRLTICGSYRRGLPTSGDIDLLLTHPSFTSNKKSTQDGMLRNVVDHLTEAGVVIDTISQGKSKFMGVCRLDESHRARRLDIRLTPHDQYFCSILYFTGSDEFNREMRAHALSQGFTLSEYSLRPIGSTGKPGEPVEITSEEDVFLYINYDFKSPDQRNL